MPEKVLEPSGIHGRVDRAILQKRLYDKAVRGAAAIIERPVWTVIPDVRTKLAVTAHLAEGDFAERLERALARSQKTRLIEHRREDD